jgi:hypothetical protein
MSRYTTGTLISDLNRALDGGAVSQSLNAYGAIDEGRRIFLSKVKPPELVRYTYLEEALYDQVNRYAVPEDLDYDSIIDIQKLSSYRNIDTLNAPMVGVSRRRFDQMRHFSRNIFNIGYQNGVKYLRILNPKGIIKGQGLLIHNANSLTNNGNWNVSGSIVNLSEDHLHYVTGNGSLKFDINRSATSGTIYNYTMKSVDLKSYLEKGAIFTWLETQNPDQIVSVKFTIESSVGNGYQFTVNHAHDNTTFTEGLNLLKFPLQSMVQVGIPNPGDLTRISFEITTRGDIDLTNVRIDNIVARKGVVYGMPYQSKYVFIDAETGAWKQKTDALTDIIPLEEDAYQLLKYECEQVMKSDSNKGGKEDGKYSNAESEIDAAYKRYRRDHPSETQVNQQEYHVAGNMYDGYSATPQIDYYDVGWWVNTQFYEGDGEDYPQDPQGC